MVLAGSGTYFSAPAQRVLGPIPMEEIWLQRSQPQGSTFRTAVVDIGVRTVRVDVRTVRVGGRTIRSRTQTGVRSFRTRLAFDRRTGAAVACCGSRVSVGSLTVRFPFDTQRRPYPLWDVVAGRAVPARFRGTGRIDGVAAYRFVSTVPATRLGTIDLPAFLLGERGPRAVTADRRIRASTTLWVEPTTGSVLQVFRQMEEWASGPGRRGTLSLWRSTLSEDRESVHAAVAAAASQRARMALVGRWLPVGLATAGAVLAIVGGVIVARYTRVQLRRPSVPEDERAEEHPP
jgi:hypothetical protein